MSKYLVMILLVMAGLAFGNNVNKKTYQTKTDKYYNQYKKEFSKLPVANKKKILNAYYNNLAYDLGYTMAGTMFLENRGMDTSFNNKKSINKNNHGTYVTYDCGDYGINTMTYLRSIGKVTKKHSTHIEACKTLSKNKALNHKLALDTYEYGLTKSKGNILKSWNVYNTGDVKTVNDRIYQMKGIIMVLEKEVKANKIEEYRLALL